MNSYQLEQEQREEWLKSLNEGDKVAVYHYSSWTRCKYSVSTITKITPTGRIRLDNGKEFNPNGSERGGSKSAFSSSYEIRKLTIEIEDLVNRVKASDELDRIIQKTKLEELPLEVLQQMIVLLKPKED